MPERNEKVLFQIFAPVERVTIRPFWPCTVVV